jgi:hypothetical protein
MRLQTVFVVCTLLLASPVFAENILDDILSALTEVSDAMVSVANVKMVANDVDLQSATGRDVFRLNEKEVIVFFNLYGVTEGEVIHSVWSRLENNTFVAFANASLTVPENFNNRAYFKLPLVQDGNTRLPGQYKVELKLKEKVLHTAYMSLVDTAPSRQISKTQNGSAMREYIDNDFGLSAHYPVGWTVTSTSQTIRRFELSQGQDAGVVYITVQFLTGKSQGGQHESLDALANGIKLESIEDTENVTISPVEFFEFENDGLIWPSASFGVQASLLGENFSYRQIFYLFHDNVRDIFYTCYYTAPLDLFEKYETAAKRIVSSFDFHAPPGKSEFSLR